jgi:hypothetical protein
MGKYQEYLCNSGPKYDGRGTITASGCRPVGEPVKRKAAAMQSPETAAATAASTVQTREAIYRTLVTEARAFAGDGVPEGKAVADYCGSPAGARRYAEYTAAPVSPLAREVMRAAEPAASASTSTVWQTIQATATAKKRACETLEMAVTRVMSEDPALYEAFLFAQRHDATRG